MDITQEDFKFEVETDFAEAAISRTQQLMRRVPALESNYLHQKLI